MGIANRSILFGIIGEILTIFDGLKRGWSLWRMNHKIACLYVIIVEFFFAIIDIYCIFGIIIVYSIWIFDGSFKFIYNFIFDMLIRYTVVPRISYHFIADNFIIQLLELFLFQISTTLGRQQ